MDFTNGKWVYPSQENGQVISAVTIRRCEKDLQTIGSEKADCIRTTPSNKRNKQKNANGIALSARHLRRSNEEDATLSPETCIQNANQGEVLDSGTSLDLDLSMPPLQGKSSLKQSEDSNQYSVSEEGDDEKHPTPRKRGRPPRLQGVGADTLGETTLGETVDQTPPKSDAVIPYGPIVIGLTHNDMLTGPRVKKSTSLLKVVKKTMTDEGKQLAASAAASESPKEGEVTNLKRKRGRPPKVIFRVGSPKTNEAVPENAENRRLNVADVEGSIERPSPADEIENPVAVVEPLSIGNSPFSDPHTTRMSIISDQFKRSRDIRRLSFGKRSVGKRQVRKHCKIPIAAAEPANTFILRGKKLKSIKEAEIPTKDTADKSIGRPVEDPDNEVGRDVAVVAVASSNASEDDKPLSAWLEGAHSPSETDACQLVETGVMRDASSTPSCCQSKEVQQEKDETSAGNSSHDNDATQRPDETLTQSTAIVPRANQELPFEKNSLIWGVIESMEVLKRIPQNPHFFPLYNIKEECREGLAIGSMVTFTSLAEKVSRARFDDPKSLLDGYLEALVDLEELGFNVVPVQELLHKLISIKTRCEQAENTCKEMESQIKEQTQEKSKMEDEIAELEKKTKELKEKQALAMSKKERKDTELTLLQSSMDAVKGSLEGAQQEFDKVTASLR
ncbi:uncharacterized protein LOC141652436 isoform X2 [Silene latifolia]|uniref:uncharacterized protein LOC141652436 isoform X2 n=1 Tax=Silene latifolia TaxID=37657 RepID=UPI003D76F321